MVKKRLAVLGFFVLSLLVAAPASGQPPPEQPPTCPPGFTEKTLINEESPQNRNDNGKVCEKPVPGRGNTGNNSNYKDDIAP